MASKLSAKEKPLLAGFITVLRSAAVGAAFSAAVLLLFSFIMSRKDVPLMLLNPVAALLLAAACFISGYLASRSIRRRGMAVGALCGALIFAVLALISLMRGPSMGAAALIKLAMAVISGAAGGVLGVNAKRKRK